MAAKKEKSETWKVRIERAIRRAEVGELHVLISEARACMVDADKYLKPKKAGGDASKDRLAEMAEARRLVKAGDPLDGTNWRTNPFWYAYRLAHQHPDWSINAIAKQTSVKFGVGYERMRKHVRGIRYNGWNDYLKTGGDGS